jgi:hypothetical protein
LESDRPAHVKRFTHALSTPAMIRLRTDAAHRELAMQRSMNVVNEPWDADRAQVGISREFDFMRDFFNLFHECLQSCETLDLVRVLASGALATVEPSRHTATAIFWTESYLNEVYIFHLRLLDLIKFIQRRYKKDADFTEFILATGDSLTEFVNDQLEPLKQDRGAHVHQRRHRRADPELARLELLDTLIDLLGRSELVDKREQCRKEATEWVIKQITHFSRLAWHLLDEVCRGFSEGILLENDKLIVPSQFKDDPKALLDVQKRTH